MSVSLPPLSAPASTHPPAHAPARSNNPEPSHADSFEKVLSQARQPASEAAAKSPEKAAGNPPARRHGDASKAGAEEPADTALLPGMVWLPLESRRPPPLPGAGADTSTRGFPRQGTVADPLVLSPLNVSLAANGVATPTVAGVDVNVPTPALVLAAAGAKERGQVPTETRIPAGTPGDTAPAVPDAAEIAPRILRDTPLSQLPLPPHEGKTAAKPDAGGEAATALPAATYGAAKQASSVALPAGEAVAATPLTTGMPAPSAAGMEAGAMPAVGMMGPASPGPVDVASAGRPLPAFTPSLPQDIGSSEWGKALGQQLMQMGQAGHEVAELQLNPPGLGPLKVTLSMNDHQIQAAFASAHSSVRAAVEAALPQLRAALADSGISLGDTSVSSDSRQPSDADQGQGGSPGQRGHAGTGMKEPANAPERPVLEPRRQGNGASVDIYA